ncbi:MAG: protease family protein [Acidobacteriota bacterium]|nr:protease family protein [Acidobacteriota bacterium]
MSWALTAFLAIAVAFFMDRLCEARGLLPPGFREPWRRTLGWTLVALILWIGAFASLASIGQDVPEMDLSQLTTPRLFLLHFLLILTIISWFLLGFAGLRPAPPPPPLEELPDQEPAPAPAPVPLFRRFQEQFGFVAPDVPREIGVGVLVGIGSWGAVLAVAILMGLIIMALGGEDSLPKQPPALIPWIVALPIGVRILISLSAGVVEETFFRGFLQPRIGIFLSTLLFVLAHFSYGQPLMLVGIGTLSLIYAFLVRWRQNIWPAIAAHFLFDAVQLLFIIPILLKYMEKAPTGN